MSASYIDKIICPECGREGTFTYWSTINTMQEKVMRKMVRTGSAFMYTCPECGKTTIVDYPFIYHQMEDQMMIYYAKEDKVDEAEKYFAKQEETFEELKVGGEVYLNRIVTSLDEFLEKLKIFDADMDDRIVEIVKIIYAQLIMQQNPEAKFDNIFFTYGPEGQKLLSFMVDGAAALSIELSADVYESIENQYAGKIPALRHSEPLVNREWAINFLSN